MTEVARAAKSNPEPSSPAGPMEPIATLPFVGPTTVEDVVFYAVLGAVTVAEVVAWPTAILIGSAHALHQRAHGVVLGRRAVLLEGALDEVDEFL